MPFAALHTKPLEQDYTALRPAPDIAHVDVASGYGLWLEWVQKLLCTSSLVLYRLDRNNAKPLLRQMACLPGNAQSNPTMLRLAQRCADTSSVVKAVDKDSFSLLAVPDVVGKQQAQPGYILLVLRESASELTADAQARLIVWAFTALAQYTQNSQMANSANDLTRWVIAQLHSEANASCTYAQLVDQIARREKAQCCLLGELQVHGNVITAVRLKAVSGQSVIDNRLVASRALSANIEDIYLGKDLPLDISNKVPVHRAVLQQMPLQHAAQKCARLSLPLSISGSWYVVVLERDTQYTYSEIEAAALGVEIQSALLLVQQINTGSQGVASAVALNFKQWRASVAHSWVNKAGLALIGALLLLTFAYPVEHRVSAPLSIEAAERHVMIAPIDGFVQSIEVKAGDQVVEGQTLATLDDLNLRLEQQKLQSQSLQNQQSYAKALARHDRVEVTRLKEQASLIDAELAQVTMQRNDMVLTAPVDGVVLSAALDDYLGGAVTAGDTLFSLGSNDSHRLVLNVSEYDVTQVQEAQHVGLRLAAEPSRVLAAKVVSVMPLVVATAGANTVQVHASLLDKRALRPGMQGVGKILIGRQPLAIQWLDRLITRVVWLGWKIGLLR